MLSISLGIPLTDSRYFFCLGPDEESTIFLVDPHNTAGE